MAQEELEVKRIAHGPNTHPDEWEAGVYMGNDGYTMHLDAGGFFDECIAAENASRASEIAARHENFCRGCGGHKSIEGHPVLCWSCWKGQNLPFTPFKYFNGNFAEWLSEVKAKTGKVFTQLEARL